MFYHQLHSRYHHRHHCKHSLMFFLLIVIAYLLGRKTSHRENPTQDFSY